MIINLTPHTITIVGQGQGNIVLESKGVARAVATTVQIGTIDGIPVNSVTMGEVTGLPAEQDGTILIVSRIVAEAVKGTRTDCLIVDKTVRNEQGQIIGCSALARV